MKKIIVIGCPGSGKSTFSRALHDATGIQLFHLDMLYWNADGTCIEESAFMEKLTNTILLNEWIIDGNYASTLELRIQACDTAIFLDYPLEVCLDGINTRKGKKRSDMPWVEPKDGVDEDFIDFVKNYRQQIRPDVIKLLGQYSDKDVFIFKDRGEADEFLAQL